MAVRSAPALPFPPPSLAVSLPACALVVLSAGRCRSFTRSGAGSARVLVSAPVVRVRLCAGCSSVVPPGVRRLRVVRSGSRFPALVCPACAAGSGGSGGSGCGGA